MRVLPRDASAPCAQELLEAEAANSKSIEDVIEEERAKVDARTPITEEARARGLARWTGRAAGAWRSAGSPPRCIRCPMGTAQW